MRCLPVDSALSPVSLLDNIFGVDSDVSEGSSAFLLVLIIDDVLDIVMGVSVGAIDDILSVDSALSLVRIAGDVLEVALEFSGLVDVASCDFDFDTLVGRLVTAFDCRFFLAIL